MDRVCAVIVTYNRKELLRECLRAVLSQTRPPDHVLVVDNASTDGTPEMLREEFPQVEVLRLPENQGGAGGFYEGMKRAYEQGYEWIWIMDDDAMPSASALERLLYHDGEAAILVPLLQDSQGRRYGAGRWFLGYRPVISEATPVKIEVFSFVGPLVKREVIKDVGLPQKEFFIWADDWEWSLRVALKGFDALFIPGAVVSHEYGGKARWVKRFGRSSLRSPEPAWKYYYGTRNIWVMLGHFPYPRRLIERLAFIARSAKWALGDFLYESDWPERIAFRLRGFYDGTLGRLGKTVQPK